MGLEQIERASNGSNPIVNYFSKIGANTLYHRSNLSSKDGIKTEGEFSEIWGDGYGRFGMGATGMITGDQEAVHTFELTA